MIKMYSEEILMLRGSTSTISNSQHDAIEPLLPSIADTSKALDCQSSSIDSSSIDPILIEASNDDDWQSAALEPPVIEGIHGSMASCYEFDKVVVELRFKTKLLRNPTNSID